MVSKASMVVLMDKILLSQGAPSPYVSDLQ